MIVDQTRRQILGSAAAMLAAGVTQPAIGAAPTRRAFPKGFLWGTATAAHQVEGNNVNSDWWILENVPGTIVREPSGDACDHYNRYPQDIALIAGLGLGSYRFSIEWARVEPAPGLFSTVQLDHYRAMLAECRRRGLHTVVTLHHFTSPNWLCRQGGFENPETIAAFARYAERVIRHCGDLIDVVCTFNEANLNFADFMPADTLRPMLTAAAGGAPRWRSYLFDRSSISKPIVQACHVKARAAIKAIRPDLPIGLTLAMSDIQDAPNAPGFGKAERSKRYDGWLTAAREDDFVGVQNYTRERYDAKGGVEPPAGAVRTQIGQEYYPAALAGAVRYAAEVSRRPIYVTENGIGIEDDRIRARYIQEALVGLQQCITTGVDVRGYWHWSALDNFEWTFGYGPKFGLVAVDRSTQRRTIKGSAGILSQIVRRNSV